MFQLPECDYCERTDSLKKIGGSIVCPEHIDEPNKKATPKETINPQEILKQSRAIDTSIQTRADLFNAETVSIAELFKAIDADETIENKPFAKATELQNRINIQKQVIFDLNQKIVDENSKQRAQMQALNQLANTLRQEEREKLKIQDINYKPRDVRIPVTKKTLRQSSKRINKEELRKASQETGIPEFTLRLFIIQKNLTVPQAVAAIKKSLEGKIPAQE